MPRFLLALSLGPVQSLIADAHRTRDLWGGSWLLSEAARAAARKLHELHPGCLVFPCPANLDDELKPQDVPRDQDAPPGTGAGAERHRGDDMQPRHAPRETGNIANILRAEVALADRAAVLALCHEAKRAAALRVKQLAERARRRVGNPLREDVWRTQIDDVLESFAAWAEIANEDGGYRNAGSRLNAALNARKATRDFQPCQPLTGEPLPKSSLDGARETVLPRSLAEGPARKLRLSPGEQLDALGVIKRLAGDAEQFTALPRIAADSWIEQLTPDQQQRLQAAYKPLVDAGQATRVRGNADAYATLPFDGHLLYPSRLELALAQAREPVAGGTDAGRHRGAQEPATNEAGSTLDDGEDAEVRAAQAREPATSEAGSTAVHALEAFRQCITRINDERTDTGQRVGTPVPYAAILKADGDRMGQLLSRARNAEESRAISRALHGFASGVHGIVRDHRGHAIYAGGDDVLALLPLERAPECARGLAESFSEHLGEVVKGMELADECPTLSVGLGIGYVIDPLGALRALADRAERHAKGDATQTPRNALAILLKIRSGAELHWRAPWTDRQAFDALNRFIGAYRRGELPTRAAYDLRDIGRRLAWLRDSAEETARGMRTAEVQRLLDRARRDGGSEAISPALQILIRDRALSGDAADGRPLDALADTLIIARWLSARTAGDVGE
ncbi:MAG: type III-B CRISPR-associated protein Cas10/Cmr2 [Acidobacteria bacterium]|nr:type III-B CRISPR-associated protein Cas10/Cmr2 [Acidobacteriota bacterium]